MRRAILFAIAVFFFSASLVQACEYCEKLGRLKVAEVVRTSATRAEAEQRLQQLVEAKTAEVKPQQRLASKAVDEKKPDLPQPPPEKKTVVADGSRPAQEATPATAGKTEFAQAQIPAEPVAEQIIVATMADAQTLLFPTEQILSEQKEKAAKTEQLTKHAEFKEKVKKQKLVDAGVTTSAIGTAFIPGVGPFIAGGIILGRTIYGLFQDDSENE